MRKRQPAAACQRVATARQRHYALVEEYGRRAGGDAGALREVFVARSVATRACCRFALVCRRRVTLCALLFARTKAPQDKKRAIM